MEFINRSRVAEIDLLILRRKNTFIIYLVLATLIFCGINRSQLHLININLMNNLQLRLFKNFFNTTDHTCVSI
jgi:hypothetical protein